MVVIGGLGSVRSLRPLLPKSATYLPLPAFSGPALPRYRPGDLADALDALLPPESCVVVGVSLGGAIALAMRSPWVSYVVALDPPLHPETSDVLMAQVRAAILPLRPDLAPFFAEALSEYPIRTKAPAWVVVGDFHGDGAMPTLCSSRDRRRLEAAGARLVLAPGAGHDVARFAPKAVADILTACLHDDGPDPPSTDHEKGGG